MLDHVVRARDRKFEEVEDPVEDGQEECVENREELELWVMSVVGR